MNTRFALNRQDDGVASALIDSFDTAAEVDVK